MNKKLFNFLCGLFIVCALFAGCKGLNDSEAQNESQNGDDVLVDVSDYFTFVDQPKVLADVLLYEKDSEKLPILQVSVLLKKSGIISFEWYKKSSDNNDLLLSKSEKISIKEIDDTMYTSSYKVELDHFSGNYLVDNLYYCKVIFESENKTVFSNSDVCSVKNVIKTGLKTLYVTTDSGEFPPCEYLYGVDGCDKYVTVGQEKLPGRLIIKQDDGTIVYDSGEYEKKKSGITIKVRGNGSAYADKKPFKIKLQKKEDLLFRGDKKYKDKNWNLIGKAESFSTIFGLTVSDIVYDSWTPKFEYVNVVLNNEYLGVYILVESIEENSDCRIDVADDGFCVERDLYVWWENMYEKNPDNIAKTFTSASGKIYSFVYPDDDLKDEDIDYIKSCIDSLESSIKDGTYDKVMDVKSWASWILVHDIVGQKDAYGANKYISKYSRSDSDLLKMETTWDFDQICKNPDSFVSLHDKDTAFYFAELFSSPNKAFVNAYKELWNEIEPTLIQDINIWSESFTADYEASIDAAYKLEVERWNLRYTPTVKKCFKTINDWMKKRVSFINSNIDNL